MWGALALVLCVWAVVWRTEVLLRVFLPRWFDLAERRVTLEDTVRNAKPEREPLPPDLEAVAARETEPWAREQVRAALQDEYERSRDWDTVRAAYMGADA